MQQTHGSLQSPGEPSVCRLSYAAYSAADEALPPRCSRAAGSLRLLGALHPMRQPRLESPCLFSVGRGSPFWCSRPTAPFGRRASPPSVVGVMLHTQRQTRLSLPVQQSCRLPPGLAGAPHPTHQTAPRSSCKRDPPVQCSKAQLPSDAARVPHLTSAIVLLFQQHAGLASPTPQAAAPVVHRTSSPVALPPFHLPTSIHISPQQAYFGGQLTLALWPLSHASSFFWGVLWVRAMFRARSPPPGQQAKICLPLLSD